MQVCLVGGLAVPLEGLSPTVTTFLAVCGIVQREMQVSKHSRTLNVIPLFGF